MKPEERIVTFPVMGKENALLMKSFLEDLGLTVILPPKTTDETIRKGVRHCANMICYPLKTTLGNYIEALDLGANTLLAYDTQGVCRFRQYNKLHEFTLTGLGYEFDMFVVKPNNLVGTLKRLSGKSTLTILRNIYRFYQQMKQHDEQEWSSTQPNIGLIGEIYVINNEEINHNLEEKIRNFDCNPFNTATTADFIRDKIPLFNPFKHFKKDRMKDYKRRAEAYLNGPVGGHAVENLYNLLELRDRGVDGVIHVAPLACTAESCIEPYINHVCKEGKIPLLRIPIDENSAETHLDMRLETFCELIKMKRDGVR